MSSLIFVGVFSLPVRGENHAATHPPALPADIQIYARTTDPLLPNETVAIVIVKGYVPPGDIAGDLLLESSVARCDMASFPGNTTGNAAGYDGKLPDFHWPLIFGLGTVSGTSSKLPNGQVSFPVSDFPLRSLSVEVKSRLRY